MCCTMKFISLPLASLVSPPVHSLLCLLFMCSENKEEKEGKKKKK